MQASEGPVIAFPLRGEWVILNPLGHHRYAFDFVATGGSRRRYFSKGLWQWLLGSISVDDWYGWSQPVYAPFDAKVVNASDGWPDNERTNLFRDAAKTFVFRPKIIDADFRPFAGNFLVLQSAWSWALLAHLRSGSLKVSVGEQVLAGKVLGAVGNSGSTLGPHLHFQLMDGIDPLKANVIPYRIRRYELWDGTVWQVVENGKPGKGDHVKVTVP